MSQVAYLIVNFGGPRTLKEVEPFLRTLLTDKDVIRTKFPQVIHNLLFGRVAKKRAAVISHDYAKIGGGSPIWIDTEYAADALRHELKAPVLTFHRYLPSTHKSLLEELNVLNCEEIHVFPMFPQFTYATTGSIARFFAKHLSKQTLHKMRWVKSYPNHPAYVHASQNVIREFLENRGLNEEEVFFLFSAHGLPKTFVETGDPYEHECTLSYDAIRKPFPKSATLLCYQSKFGRGEWLRPYSVEVCEQIKHYMEAKKYTVFVPLSFTSDHIETLFEIQEQYLPLIEKQGVPAFRVPSLNRHPLWISAITEILSNSTFCKTSLLVR